MPAAEGGCASLQRRLPRNSVARFTRGGLMSSTANARRLRMMGLSLLATASAAGMTYADTLSACSGITPSVELPDLPGLVPPPDVGPGQFKQKCHPATVALIRRMRADRYTLAEIAKAAGVGTTTVSRYIPPKASTVGDRRRKVTPEVRAEIARLTRDEHLSYDKIALRLGLTLPTVLRYAQ